MHGENFKEGSVPICWISVGTEFQILKMKFP